jgi:rhodanese-related sulfurtransferase
MVPDSKKRIRQSGKPCLFFFGVTNSTIFPEKSLEMNVKNLTARFCLAAALLMAAITPASAADTPTTLPGGKVISAEEGQAQVGKARFYDMRKAINFGKGHIKGAVALPYTEKSKKTAGFDASQDRFDVAKLPTDKNAPIVFYSDGPSGWKSYKAAVFAIKAGHKNVMWMRGGVTDWTAKGYALE